MPVSSFNDVMYQNRDRRSVKEVLEFLKTNPSNDRIHDFLSHDYVISARIQLEIFKYFAMPNDRGVSKVVPNDILFKLHPSFAAHHGSWRSYAKRDMGLNLCVAEDGSGYYLNGYLNPDKSNYIRPDIHRAIKKYPCVKCGTRHRLQTDHKNGRKDDPIVWNPETQTVHHFQCLCQVDNLKKKSACEKCLKCGLRPDARKMPEFRLSPFGWTEGGEEYDEVHGCHGCVWYDVEDFRIKYEIAIGLRNNHKLNTIIERYNMNIPDPIINKFLESIPPTEEMNGLAIQLASGNSDIGRQIMVCQKITEIFTKMNSFKEIIQDFKTLKLSDEDSKADQESPGKNENGSQTITMKDLSLKVNYVYNYDGVYFKVNDPTGGNGSITVIGYDPENPFVKKSESKDANWAVKLSGCSRITAIKKVRYNMETDYPQLGKGEKTRLKEVGEVSNYTKPNSFKELVGTQVASDTSTLQKNGVQANTSTLSGDGVCASAAA